MAWSKPNQGAGDLLTRSHQTHPQLTTALLFKRLTPDFNPDIPTPRLAYLFLQDAALLLLG
jgi:hypothetical protein